MIGVILAPPDRVDADKGERYREEDDGDRSDKEACLQVISLPGDDAVGDPHDHKEK